MNALESQRHAAISKHLLAAIKRIDREIGYDRPPTPFEMDRVYSRVLWFLETSATIEAQGVLDETMSQYVEGSLTDADIVKTAFEGFVETKKRKYLNAMLYEDPKPAAQQQEF